VPASLLREQDLFNGSFEPPPLAVELAPESIQRQRSDLFEFPSTDGDVVYPCHLALRAQLLLQLGRLRQVGWEGSITAFLPPQNRTCLFQVIRLKQATYFTICCSLAVGLLVIVQVYQPQVANGVFSTIFLWFDIVGVQFFPIKEAFSASITDMILVLGNSLFTGSKVLDIGLVPFLPVYPQTWVIRGMGASNQGMPLYAKPSELQQKSPCALVSKHLVVFSCRVQPSPVPFLFPVPGLIGMGSACISEFPVEHPGVNLVEDFLRYSYTEVVGPPSE
jgi:hypothetical protein